jgi:PAS domain S-box-containing protein
MSDDRQRRKKPARKPGPKPVSDPGTRTAWLASIVESSNDAIMGKTLDGIITTWNPAAERMYGWRGEEIIGQPVERLIPPGNKNEMVSILKQIRDGRRVEHYETVRLRKDGTTVAVSLTVSPILDVTAKVIGASSIARDISERKRAEEQAREATSQQQASQYARSLIEASLDPLVTISAEGKITDVNEATIKVTGVAREDLIGTDFSDYFTDPDMARAGYRQVFSQGFVTDYPLTIRHRHGTLTHVLYNASVYKDDRGNVLGVFAAARDVTAQRKAEAEVAEQRTRELERAKEIERLAELERFQKLTVGRELKMIELKKEIEELKKLIPPAEAPS